MLEDTYDTFYNSASSAPTNPKVQLVEPDPTTYVNSNYASIFKTTITPPIRISDYKICQQIQSCIFNDKQDTKYFNRYEIHWRNPKENWDFAISVAQYDFMLKYEYALPEKYDPYA